MSYFDECKYIWNNLLPKRGQADNLHGELLRQIEKLRYEAQDNGNINWDSNFEFFCDFLKDTLIKLEELDEKDKKAVENSLSKIKKAGTIASKFSDENITDEELYREFGKVSILDCAYVDDDIYDVVSEAIGKFYHYNDKFIPYEKNPNIFR